MTTDEQERAEIKARRAELPELPEVLALDMLRAGAWTPNAEHRAAIKAYGDFFEWLGMDRRVSITVRDVYNKTTILGYLHVQG